jgi:mRNA interferase MazF
MPKLQQGLVIWAELPAPAGRRPVLVITRDSALGNLNSVTVAPITRTVRNIPTEVRLEPADGVPTPCAVNLDNIFTLERANLAQPIVTLTREKMLQVFIAIRSAFDMP